MNLIKKRKTDIGTHNGNTVQVNVATVAWAREHMNKPIPVLNVL